MGIELQQNGDGTLRLIDDLTSKEVYRWGAYGANFHDLNIKSTQYDDFNGKAITGLWDVQKGSDGSTANFAVNAAASGTVRATTGAGAGGTMAVNGVQLCSALNWKAANGSLVFEAKVKLSAITAVSCFVGLTDQVAALEAPATLTTTTFTTNATDAIGFLFDTNATTVTIRCVGVANDVDATHTDTGLAYVAATYRTFRIEVDTSGVAKFFIDGVVVNSGLTGAVTASVALTPVVSGFATAAASRTVDVDYIYVQQTR
jgi:hypothetical protein